MAIPKPAKGELVIDGMLIWMYYLMAR
jgi:hypothetical protein